MDGSIIKHVLSLIPVHDPMTKTIKRIKT